MRLINKKWLYSGYITENVNNCYKFMKWLYN